MSWVSIWCKVHEMKKEEYGVLRQTYWDEVTQTFAYQRGKTYCLLKLHKHVRQVGFVSLCKSSLLVVFVSAVKRSQNREKHVILTLCTAAELHHIKKPPQLTCVVSVTDANCKYSEFPQPKTSPSSETARQQSP